jgi:hypothetical protein
MTKKDIRRMEHWDTEKELLGDKGKTESWIAAAHFFLKNPFFHHSTLPTFPLPLFHYSIVPAVSFGGME